MNPRVGGWEQLGFDQGKANMNILNCLCHKGTLNMEAHFFLSFLFQIQPSRKFWVLSSSNSLNPETSLAKTSSSYSGNSAAESKFFSRCPALLSEISNCAWAESVRSQHTCRHLGSSLLVVYCSWVISPYISIWAWRERPFLVSYSLVWRDSVLTGPEEKVFS